MHHAIIDRWSRGASLIHRRDARVKIAAALALLIGIATTRALWPVAAYGILAAGAALAARLPLAGVMARAAVVLPFSGAFAAVSWLGGDAARAASLLAKSYVSALAAVLLVATTPLPELMRGMESLGAPRFLVLVIQFVYRYLFVISEQGQHMRLAAACRAGDGKARRSRLRAAAGAVGVLFARSYLRAEGIHQAMLARGFEGRFPLAAPGRIRPADVAFLAVSITLTAAVWIRGRIA